MVILDYVIMIFFKVNTIFYFFILRPILTNQIQIPKYFCSLDLELIFFLIYLLNVKQYALITTIPAKNIILLNKRFIKQ